MTLRIKIPEQMTSTGTTPMAPKAGADQQIINRVEEMIRLIEDEVLCRAGCGMTCHPDEFIAGFCSRFCMKEFLGVEYD
jgi:hypothetical protein